MTPTLETVETLANQLSEQDQQALLQRLIVKLQISAPGQWQAQTEQSEHNAARKRVAKQLLAEAEGTSDDGPCLPDATETIRQLREERHFDISGDMR